MTILGTETACVCDLNHIPGKVMGKQLQPYEDIKKELGKARRETSMSEISSLVLLDDYFKGTGYGSGGADGLTLDAPAALFCLDNSYNVPNQDEGITRAHTDA